jgi:disulfide bond formation protein DsbB
VLESKGSQEKIMTMRPKELVTARRGFAVLGIGAVALVVGGILLGEWLKLAPCPLCIFQRLMYLTVGAMALTAAVVPRAALHFGGASLFAALGGLATAAYQSWIQAFPVAFAQCGTGEPTNIIEHLVEVLGQWWPWMFYAWGECTSREWELFGLSLANLSLVAFMGFVVAIAVLLRLNRQRHRA